MAKRLNKPLVAAMTFFGFAAATGLGIWMVVLLQIKDPKEYVARAHAAVAEEDWAAAQLYYRRAYRVSQDEVHLVEAGKMAFRGGNELRALALWNQVKTQAPQRTDARQELLNFYLEMSRVQGGGPWLWSRVKEEADGLRDKDPVNLTAMFGQGLALSNLTSENPENFGAGVRQLEEVVRAAPEVQDYVAALVRVYLLQAHSVEPETGTPAEVVGALAKYDSAEKLCRALVALHPEQGKSAAEARWHLATFLDSRAFFLASWDRDSELQETLRAETFSLYEEALQLAGDDEEALANAKLQLGKYWARHWKRDMKAVGPDAPITTEHFEEARRLMQEAVDLNPDALESYRLLAALYGQAGKFREAVQVCNARLELPIRRKGMHALEEKLLRYLLLLQAAEASIELAATLPRTDDEWGHTLERAQAFINDAEAETQYKSTALCIHLAGRVKLQQNYQPQALSLFQEAEDEFRLIDSSAPLYRRASVRNKVLLSELQLEKKQFGAALETITRAVLDAPRNPAVWVALGRVRLKNGEPELAAQAADQALALAPGMPSAILVKVDAFHALGRPDKVRDALSQLPADSRLNLVLQAQMLGLEGRHEEALHLVLPELEKDPADPDLVRQVVSSYMQMENRDAAQAVVRRALEIDPTNIQLRAWALATDPSVSDEERERQQLELIGEIEDPFTRALTYIVKYSTLGDTDKQLEHLEIAERLILEQGSKAAVESGPKYLGLLLESKFVLVGRHKDWSALEDIVQVAREHDVDGADGKMFEGLLYMFRASALADDSPELRKQQRDLWELAAAAFAQARETQKTDARNLLRLGQCYLALGRETEAREALESAVKANPKNAQAHKTLAVLGQRSGDRDTYLEHLAIAAELIPDDPWVQSAQLAEREITAPQEGIARREEMRKKNPQDLSNLLKLADLYDRVDRGDDAAGCYEDALAKAPDNHVIVNKVATFFRKSGAEDRAENALRALVAARTDPAEQAEAQLLVGQHFALVGDVAKADAEFAKAADLQGTTRVFAGLADHYYGTGRYLEARQWQQRALELPDPTALTVVMALKRMGISCLLKLNDKQEAALEVAAYQQDYPEDPRGWRLLSAVEHRRGRLDEAINAIDRFIQSRPDDPQGLYARVQLYFSLGRWSAAIADLERMRAQHPDAFDFAPRIRLAGAYAVNGQEDMAVSELQTVSEENPDARHVSRAWVELLFSLRRHAEAQQVLTGLISRFPEEPEWYALRGRASYRSDDHPDALADFRRAVEASEYLPEYVAELLDLYVTENAVADGILFYEQSVPEQRRSPVVRYHYAHLLALRGDTTAAVQLYRKVMNDDSLGFQDAQRLAVDANSAFPDGGAIDAFENTPVEADLEQANNHILSGLLTVAGRDVEGAALAESLRQVATTDVERLLSLAWLGEIYTRTREYDKAKRCFEETLEINPDSISALNNLAYILADELGQPEQALPYAKRAALLSERRGASDVGMSGKWAPIFDTLGWVHARLGDFADARGELSRAVQADPQFLPAYYHLAEVYRMQGDFDQAKQFLDRVTQIISARSVSSDAAYRTKIDEASDKIRRRVSD
ncbi:MAG: tetratricopeptide repeat protein [Planctomycetes bacterium]|nr:tetratricopeptide repeat protein [Planctomycetota bacterium]